MNALAVCGPGGGAKGVAIFANDLAEAGCVRSNGKDREFLGVFPAVSYPFGLAVGRKGDPLIVWRPRRFEVKPRGMVLLAVAAIAGVSIC